MPYSYPKHFIYPEGHSLYFFNHVEKWLTLMPDLLGKTNVTLEIGALFGGTSVFILDTYCKAVDSHHHIVDINTNDFIEMNLKPYTNYTYHLGESADVLRGLTHFGQTKDFLDLVYIDGNHMAKFVLEDAVNCFYLTKPGGYMVFDDYTWGTDNPDETARPSTAIHAFLHIYQKHVEIIDVGWQVIVRKIDYKFTDAEKASNYYTDWQWTTKTALQP